MRKSEAYFTFEEEMKTLIKEYRKRYGLTQQQLADRVYVTKRTIISIEKGYYNPSIMLAYRIAEVFNTSIEDLCCLKENKREEDEANNAN